MSLQIVVNPIKIIEGIQQVENVWGDFIQNGPSTGIGGYVRDQYRNRCNQFANLPPWAQALSAPVAGSFQRACEPYWADNAWDGPVNPGPPFNGGQCPVFYNVSWQERRFVGGTWVWSQTFSISLLGPISIDKAGERAPFTCTGVAQFDNNAALYNADGVRVATFQNACTDDPKGYQIISINRADGLPDECGDPPDAPLEPGPNPPPDPGPSPGPEPTDDPRGGPIPVVPIPPYDDPTFGPTPIEEPAEGEPGGGGEPPTAGGGDGLPGADDAVGGEAGQVGGGEGGEDVLFGPPPEGRVWVGCIAQFTVDTRFGNIPGTGPENTVYPFVIGNGSLIYAGGRGRSHSIRSKFFDLYRPVTTLVVEGAFIQCQPGVSASIRPVSAIICPENTCGAE